MIITTEQLVNGLLKYTENEVIAPLPTIGKWGAGAFIVLIKNNIDNVISYISTIPMAKTLGVITEDGLINTDILCNALIESANRYGKIQVTYPVIGTLIFSSDDILRLKNYMEEDNGRRIEN